MKFVRGRIPKGCSLKKILAHPQTNSEKIEKNPRIYLRIQNPYTLFGSKQPLDFSV